MSTETAARRDPAASEGRQRPARTTGEVWIQLAHPQGGGDRRVNIKLQDRASGVYLAEISMTPEEFADFISGRLTPLQASLPAVHEQTRVFRDREQETVAVPPEVGSRFEYKRVDAVTEAVERWAQETADAHSWDEFQINDTSQSFTVTFRRWATRP